MSIVLSEEKLSPNNGFDEASLVERRGDETRLSENSASLFSIGNFASDISL